MPNNPIITVEQFKMKFGQKTVIEDLSFEVTQGEVFGFLGSNGSGKTTTIRALLGIYVPTAGTLLIQGQQFSPKMGSYLGYLPEERGLYKKESVLDTMVYFGQLKGMDKSSAEKWSVAYLDRVELGQTAHQSLDKLSGGMQQKIQLGVTMMHDPSLLILDEPTKGFDPVNRRLLMDMVEERVKAGATVVLVTHQMEEVERLCQRIVLLKDGQRRLYGKVEDIRRQFGSDEVVITYDGQLVDQPKLYTIQPINNRQARLTPADKTSPQQVLAELVAQPKMKLESFQVQQPSLDDIFVQIYQGDSHA